MSIGKISEEEFKRKHELFDDELDLIRALVRVYESQSMEIQRNDKHNSHNVGQEGQA